MNTRKKTKLKLSKAGKIITIGVITSIIIITYLVKTITYKMSDEYKLLDKGYNNKEVQTILLKTKNNDKELKLIKDKRYDKNIPKLLNQKYFMFKNLDNYLNYIHKNSSESLKMVVALVNVKRNYNYYTHVTNTDVSKNHLMLVNKYNKLSDKFIPKNITPISNMYAYEGNNISKEVYDAYRSMWNAAHDKNLTLIVTSSYRDFASQKEVWDNLDDSVGSEKADAKAARPGHSEHQTGLALDIVTYNSFNNDFDKTPEFKWLHSNAHKYGFILRFPKNKENITGYNYESWHYRYVGKEIANKIYSLGITYDEYYAYYLDK